MDERIYGGVAVVAGGSAGVGRATARALADEGFDVAVLAREPARLADAEADLQARGVRARGYVADVASAQQMVDAAERIERELGEITVWINCAMLTAFGPFERVPADSFQRVVDVTFMGQVNGTRAALPAMRRRGYGRIVNIGSGLAFRAVPLQSAYSASKRAIVGFTQAVRAELIHDGSPVTLSMVQLPSLNTPQFDWAESEMGWVPQPAPPIYEPEVAADAVMRVVHSGEREVIVGSLPLMLGAGQMLSPGYMDRKMGTGAYEAQMSDEPDQGQRADNVFDPVEWDIAARGTHGQDAKTRAIVVNGDTARLAGWLGLLAGGAILGGLAATALHRR